jgi:Zn finger protein HypA/HybF involved in hydrogenase expression
MSAETSSGATEKTSLIGLEATTTLQCRRAAEIIIKCTECGNTFTKEGTTNGEVVTCPICDSQYKAVVANGKLRLEDFVLDENDPGEL